MRDKTNTLIFSTAILKSDLEQTFASSGFMSSRVPSWVYKQEQAIRDMKGNFKIESDNWKRKILNYGRRLRKWKTLF